MISDDGAHVSSIVLMLIAAVISLAIFLMKRNTGKAGAAK